MSFEWLPVVTPKNPEFSEHYSVSRSGQIRSERSGRILVPLCVGDNGTYRCVKLSVRGVTRPYFIHRLVATAFLENSENKPEVNHRDGDRTNNALSNLEWVTSSENHNHAFRELKRDRRPGEANNMARLTELDVRWIRMWRKAGYSLKAIAREWGVSLQHVSSIHHRKLWGHLA